MEQVKYRWLTLVIALFLVLLNTLPFERDINIGLSVLFLAASLWLTEAIHVSLTAILIPVMAVLLGVFSTSKALVSFANPIIFLFLGGFALASALREQGIDRALANHILRLSGGSMLKALLMLFALTAVLSMWISNTATVAMMLPLSLGLLSRLEQSKSASIYVFVLLGLAYSANIGGIGTLVGSPPNAIAAAAANISFSDWMIQALPVVFILLPVALLVLYVLVKPDVTGQFSVQEDVAFEWTNKRKVTLIIFAATVLSWIFSSQISTWLGIVALDSVIALVALLALCLTQSTTWHSIESHTDWGVLILFGGGLCLSAVLQETGSSAFLAKHLQQMTDGLAPIWIVIMIVAFVVFLTEFASNTAISALLIPLFVSAADSLALDPVMLAVLIAICASCAFMLPVATPPNALVFASGHIPQQQMIRVGLVVNMLCIMLLTLYSALFWN